MVSISSLASIFKGVQNRSKLHDFNNFLDGIFFTTYLHCASTEHHLQNCGGVIRKGRPTEKGNQAFPSSSSQQNYDELCKPPASMFFHSAFFIKKTFFFLLLLKEFFCVCYTVRAMVVACCCKFDTLGRCMFLSLDKFLDRQQDYCNTSLWRAE